MNNRVNYVVIGILVLIGIAGMATFGYWLLKPTKESQMQRYAIYFNESVLGLNLDAPVKYKGLSVGKVAGLGISRHNPEQVEVLVEILKDTPINTSTEAQLTSQGITGLSYINLTINNDIDAKPLITKESEDHPVIKSVPSILIKIENRFIDISEDLADTLQKTSRLLSDKNQEEMSVILKSTALLLSKMNSIFDENTTQNFKESMKNLKNSSEKIDKLIPRVDELVSKSGRFEDDISAAFDSIKNSYLGIQDSMNRFSIAIESGENSIKEVSGDIVPVMNSTLQDMQNLISKIEETINRYERSPADIVFTQEEIKKGPGEIDESSFNNFGTVFGGCTTIKPSVAQYSVAIDDLKINGSALGFKEKSLRVSKAFSSSSLSSHRMEYMESERRVFAYSQSQWQESPSVMIESILLKSIREAGLFKSVHPSKSRIKSDFILETNIEKFMQFFSEDMKESHVEVILNLSLIDTKTNGVVQSKTFSSRVETKSLDAEGGAEAFKSALSEIMMQNIEWLDGVCR